MEDVIVDPTVFIDYCAECDAVVRSDNETCQHDNKEWTGSWEW